MDCFQKYVQARRAFFIEMDIGGSHYPLVDCTHELFYINAEDPSRVRTQHEDGSWLFWPILKIVKRADLTMLLCRHFCQPAHDNNNIAWRIFAATNAETTFL